MAIQNSVNQAMGAAMGGALAVTHTLDQLDQMKLKQIEAKQEVKQVFS